MNVIDAPCPECGRGSVHRFGARAFIAWLAAKR
jgi:hypothetical protein